MSWGEVGKINNNYKRALNEQMRDLKFQEMRIITSTGTYTPPKTGLYKVICVGAGGDGGCGTASNTYGGGGGAGGGVAIKTLKLSASSSYSVTVSTTASFVYDSNTILTATSGGGGSYYQASTGGTASGGDSNYVGTSGDYTGKTVEYIAPAPGGVSVFLSGLYMKPSPEINSLPVDASIGGVKTISFPYGDCILNFGGGGTGAACYYNQSTTGTNNYNTAYHATSGKPAAIIIVPLEMEE